MTATERTILIQNYHPTGTAALIRDFKKLGFVVYSPDGDWGRIAYFAPNDGLGATLISQEAYFALPPGHLLVTCKAQEGDLTAIARSHGDAIVLNVAQHEHSYAAGISDLMICPDISVFRAYPDVIKNKLLYFPRPILDNTTDKDVEASFRSRRACSYISLPRLWPAGWAAYLGFKERFAGDCFYFGHESPDGALSHADCNDMMATSLFTLHFKEQESYGLSCVESMILGTPIVTLRRFVSGKTLGECFLDRSNAIVADSIEEAVGRASAMTYDEYSAMSAEARLRATELTCDERTVRRLGDVLQS